MTAQASTFNPVAAGALRYRQDQINLGIPVKSPFLVRFSTIGIPAKNRKAWAFSKSEITADFESAGYKVISVTQLQFELKD